MGQSGVALVDDQLNIIHLSAGVYSDHQLLDIITQHGRPTKLAVDSPLEVPNASGGRLCDSLLMGYAFPGGRVSMFATGRDFMLRRYGLVRGERLLDFAERTLNLTWKKDVCETYPNAIIASVFPQLYPSGYKRKAGRSLPQCIQALNTLLSALRDVGLRERPEIGLPWLGPGISGSGFKQAEDKTDALLCAYAAWSWQRGRVISFEHSQGGFTLIPRS